ncbi:Protein of unknown function [Pyronema omphalodes CBS 100304]|uniref:Uncharacterized protein n=1 Tax=Pyronema omphalodes (strain CBS 100304) TaxID=1076935 RepID=U4L3N2_PYROM|nr:Protein of unknown function [Pyronema omphalodes CBS 100304]
MQRTQCPQKQIIRGIRIINQGRPTLCSATLCHSARAKRSPSVLLPPVLRSTPCYPGHTYRNVIAFNCRIPVANVISIRSWTAGKTGLL